MPPRWTDKLARPIRDKAGAVIKTRDDARRYMAALPSDRALRQSWQHAAKLLLDGASAEEVTRQIEYAMLLDGTLTRYEKQPSR